MPPELDLFAVDRGSVTAPAGCGKTQLIADTLVLHDDPKPTLILTHTNAGVAALRMRLQRARVPSPAYKVTTIDGFAMRLIGMFPLRSGHNPQILQINDAQNDYPAVRIAASRLLRVGHISDALRASYSRLIVDEYQDCNLDQHAIVDALAMLLPAAVLGDPMQAIFGFAGQLVHWQRHVEVQFPSVGVLETPWRWRNSGAEPLGQWLMEARALLQRGDGVDLSRAPDEVLWVRLNIANADQQRRGAAQYRTVGQEETVLIIGDARNSRGRHQFASQTPGATSVEAVDLGYLVRFARRFNIGAADALNELIDFAAGVMTQVDATNLKTRVETILRRRARSPPTPAEAAAVAFSAAPSIGAALYLLERLDDQANARVFRPDILHCCRAALRAAAAADDVTLLDAVLQARERNRHIGRPLSRRAVGSTLLLKGLEADVAVILHPEIMDARNLYVALTRGARRLVVCSTTPMLTPVI
jgi:DNA helicase-2/ATP-dependent DNA helicase PcrA